MYENIIDLDYHKFGGIDNLKTSVYENMATKEWKEENIEKVREYRRNWYNRNKKRQETK